MNFRVQLKRHINQIMSILFKISLLKDMVERREIYASMRASNSQLI